MHVIAILNAVMIDKVVQRVMLKDEANKVFYGKCYQDELKHDRDALNMLDTAAGERGIEQGRQEGLQEAVNRLIASGIPAEQARRLLGLA